MPDAKHYVSITGLRLLRPWHAPVFWLHAVPALAQARRAAGNLSAEARTIGGVHLTLSMWTDRTAMLGYLRSGSHLRAMRLFPRIATGHVAGFTAPRAPDWSDVPAILRQRGREV